MKINEKISYLHVFLNLGLHEIFKGCTFLNGANISVCATLQAKLQMVPFSNGQIASCDPLKNAGFIIETLTVAGISCLFWALFEQMHLKEKCSQLTTVPRIPCRTFCLY